MESYGDGRGELVVNYYSQYTSTWVFKMPSWEFEQFAGNVCLSDAARSTDRKILSKIRVIMFDRENGVNICRLYINGEELKQVLE